MDKWKNTKILTALEDEIKELMKEGKYSSVMDFVNEAVREKLRYEKFKKTGYTLVPEKEVSS